jgi:hypothetical protein
MTLPVLIIGRIAAVSVKTSGTSPAATATAAGAPPR